MNTYQYDKNDYLNEVPENRQVDNQRKQTNNRYARSSNTFNNEQQPQRFSMRQQVENSNFRQVNDSNLSNTIQDRAIRKSNPSFLNQIVHNTSSNNGGNQRGTSYPSGKSNQSYNSNNSRREESGKQTSGPVIHKYPQDVHIYPQDAHIYPTNETPSVSSNTNYNVNKRTSNFNYSTPSEQNYANQANFNTGRNFQIEQLQRTDVQFQQELSNTSINNNRYPRSNSNFLEIQQQQIVPGALDVSTYGSGKGISGNNPFGYKSNEDTWNQTQNKQYPQPVQQFVQQPVQQLVQQPAQQLAQQFVQHTQQYVNPPQQQPYSSTGSVVSTAFNTNPISHYNNTGNMMNQYQSLQTGPNNINPNVTAPQDFASNLPLNQVQIVPNAQFIDNRPMNDTTYYNKMPQAIVNPVQGTPGAEMHLELFNSPAYMTQFPLEEVRLATGVTHGYRIGHHLLIPGFFSQTAAATLNIENKNTQGETPVQRISRDVSKEPTLQLQTKRELSRDSISEKRLDIQSVPFEPVKAESKNLLKFEINKAPTNPTKQDTNTAKATTTATTEQTPVALTFKNGGMQMKKAPQTKFQSSVTSSVFKKSEESSDSEPDELMFQEPNDLIHNMASSKNLKQRLAELDKLKEKAEGLADETNNFGQKISKLSFELDSKPVAWMVERELPPRKKLKKDPADEEVLETHSDGEIPDKNDLDEILEEDVSAVQKKFEPINGINPKVRSYRVLGQDKPRYTQEKNLLEKLDNYLVEADKVKSGDKADLKNPEDEAELEAQKLLEEDYHFDNRYFISNPTKVCHRCHQPGHMERMCPEMVRVSCLYCCGKHESSHCASVICFKCNNVGHFAKDCTSSGGMACFRCSKKGHKIGQCGIILPPTTHLRNEGVLREKRNAKSETLCLSCLTFGHINCKSRNVSQGTLQLVDELYCTEDTLEADLKKELAEKKQYSSPDHALEYEEGENTEDSVDSADERYLKKAGEKSAESSGQKYKTRPSASNNSYLYNRNNSTGTTYRGRGNTHYHRGGRRPYNGYNRDTRGAEHW